MGNRVSYSNMLNPTAHNGDISINDAKIGCTSTNKGDKTETTHNDHRQITVSGGNVGIAGGDAHDNATAMKFQNTDSK